MRTSVRTGIALSVTALAAGGLTVLGSGAAHAASPTAAQLHGEDSPVCEYRVIPMKGLNVRKKPAGKKLGALRHNKVVFAKKCNNPRGWVKLKKAEGVKLKKKFRGKYVYRPLLANQHN